MVFESSPNRDFIFPLFFPLHVLVGMNHRAVPDCLQTRLMLMAFEAAFAKPLSQRIEFKPTDLAKIRQRAITQFFSTGRSIQEAQFSANAY